MGYNFDYNFGYNYGPDLADVSSIAGTVFLVMMGVYALVGIYTVAAYVLQSLGMYTIAQRRGIKHEWLAWLPFGNLWILGSIADQYQYVSMGQVTNGRKVMLSLEIAKGVLGLAFVGVYIKMMLDAFAINFSDPQLLNWGAYLIPFVLIGLVGWVLNVILIVFRYINLYHLFASCRPRAKVAFILLSILLGFTEPFLVFACRNKDLGMPPRKPKSVYETVAIPQPVAEPVVEPVAEPVVEPAAEPVEEPVEEPVAEAEAEEPAAEE